MDSFFVRDGDRFVATELTRGPWNDSHQHGGPPSALLGQALTEAGPDAASFRLVRIMVDFVRPVPIAPLELRVEVQRAGKQVQRLGAALYADGVEVLRAAGLRIRKAALPLPPLPASRALPPPDTLPSFELDFFQSEVGYHKAIEARLARGTWAKGPIDAWMRARVPLIAGEPTSPAARVLALVDAESGMCPPLDPLEFGFPNPDLTVYFARELRGEWLGLFITSVAAPDGTGLAQSELHDEHGAFGRAAQSLIVSAR